MERIAGISRQARIGAALLAAALAVAACGSSETTEASDVGSPLAEFLGQDSFIDFSADPEEAQARFAEEQRQREEIIAACMKREGFEYIAPDPESIDIFGSEGEFAYDSREYAAKYGFGITTERFSQEEVGPDLVGYDNSRFEDAEIDDPNQEILEGMDEATLDAYYEALYGDDSSFPSFDPETMSDEELEELENQIYEPQGCEGEAWNDGASANANAFYRDFSDEITEMYEAIEDDPRIAAKEEEITSCVADKGLEFGGFDEDLWSAYEDELNEIDQMIGGFPGENLTEEDFAAMSEDELDALFNQPREFSDEAKAKLAALQAEETELAVVVWDCGGSFGLDSEMATLYQEVVAEYEQRFLDENADQLAEYKAEG
jgi:hypothetical protein